MFTNLLETRPKTQRSAGGALVSVAMHSAIIVLAIQATLSAGQRSEPRETPVQYTEVKHDEPLPPKPVVRELQVTAPARGFQMLSAPVDVPDALPAIDLSRKPTNELDWLGTGKPGGRANGVDIAPPAGNQVYYESQVEKPVMALPGSPAPRYPDIFKAAGVEGEVVVSFVVDTTGRAEPASILILKSTNDVFGAAVKTALPNMRFLPAEIAGKKVKQRVQQPFVFTISK